MTFDLASLPWRRTDTVATVAEITGVDSPRDTVALCYLISDARDWIAAQGVRNAHTDREVIDYIAGRYPDGWPGLVKDSVPLHSDPVPVAWLLMVRRHGVDVANTAFPKEAGI